MSLPIYLDYNATTPHAPEAIAAMRPFLEEHFGDPSSSHAYGRITRQAVEQARSQVARPINAKPPEIFFTSGGTEANNHAIRGVVTKSSAHIITTTIEHPAVTEVCEALCASTAEVTCVAVDGEGRVDPDDILRAIRPETALISVMHANNEAGTIQPIEAIGRLARERGIPFHTDAAQSAAKIPVGVERLGVDFLSLAGQERGRRAGTENVLDIVGLGAACEIAAAHSESNVNDMRGLRDRLELLMRDRVCRWRRKRVPFWRRSGPCLGRLSE